MIICSGEYIPHISSCIITFCIRWFDFLHIRIERAARIVWLNPILQYPVILGPFHNTLLKNLLDQFFEQCL